MKKYVVFTPWSPFYNPAPPKYEATIPFACEDNQEHKNTNNSKRLSDLGYINLSFIWEGFEIQTQILSETPGEDTRRLPLMQ